MNGQPIEELKGIGEKTGKLFRKLGIETVLDLLQYYPRSYDVFHAPVPVGQLKAQSIYAVAGVLLKPADLIRINGMQLVTATIKDLTGSLQLSWYNMPYIRSSLKSGIPYIFRGRVVQKHGRLSMEQPEIYTPEEYEALSSSLRPVYGQTKGLGNKMIAKAVSQALTIRQLEREYLPEDLRKKHQLAEYNFAVRHIHYPEDENQLLFARKRLVFDEFFLFLIGIRRLKEKRGDQKSLFSMASCQEAGKLKDSLPYRLTDAQQRTWDEVKADMQSGLAMNRLIQGDVGSGKTIIAILALVLAAENGYQGALMVPTEVLAKQHYEAMVSLFWQHGISKNPVLVTGSMTAKEKRLAYESIERHEADIIIGTHALIQEKISYDQLALVITDEQHRFGVGQREALGAKSSGGIPHVMVMSATPIPRTLAIILYGDLDISVIDQLPANRLPIKNCVVGTDYRKRAYDFIAKQVAKGRQVYVICPMVEESEMIEAENVLDYTKILKKELPSAIQVEYLHGKMKGKEKNQVMERFAMGEIQVLVSTTVIEVGVNVPNATVIMIENAERFGLAQLHQLRGRVGRGEHQSYCIMVNGSEDGDISKRLEILNHSNDGFYIASEDLKLRGPGDIFGIRQSGELEFKLADIFTDANILKTVSEEVKQLLEQDPELEMEEHQELKKRLEEYLQSHYDKLNL
ncbi:MAG: ATP-dependent DNA helicase RecG [Lachnospiraceae bacterium]|jgi:ATP-dependent DNA helicase RecG|nr:ATP-dependent DNA helicase RecG [Lachnospiraceae bacterium]